MAVLDVVSVEVAQDVVYARGGDRDLLCDIYRPSPALTKKTAVVHLHGGSFRGGSKAGARLARPLAALGYTCVAATYRVLPEATWPAQIHDAKAAIRWTRANAKRLGVVPEKVVVLGYSAGGRLALIAAGSQNDASLEGEGGQPGAGSDVAACVALYAPSAIGTATAVLGPDPSEQLRRSFSPLEYIKPGYPPTILFHGAADSMVPVDDTLQTANTLRAVGAAVELHVIEGVTHVFDSHTELAQATAIWIDLFLDRHVVNPRVYPSTEPPPR